MLHEKDKIRFKFQDVHDSYKVHVFKINFLDLLNVVLYKLEFLPINFYLIQYATFYLKFMPIHYVAHSKFFFIFALCFYNFKQKNNFKN